MNRSAKGLLIVTTTLVGHIVDDSPNLPNFLPAKFSWYAVVKEHNIPVEHFYVKLYMTTIIYTYTYV